MWPGRSGGDPLRTSCVHPAGSKRSAGRRRPVAHHLTHAVVRGRPRALPGVDFPAKGVWPAHVGPQTECRAHGAARHLIASAGVSDAGALALAPQEPSVNVPGHVAGLPCRQKQPARHEVSLCGGLQKSMVVLSAVSAESQAA